MKKSGLLIGFILLMSMFATLEFGEVKAYTEKTSIDLVRFADSSIDSQSGDYTMSFQNSWNAKDPISGDSVLLQWSGGTWLYSSTPTFSQNCQYTRSQPNQYSVDGSACILKALTGEGYALVEVPPAGLNLGSVAYVYMSTNYSSNPIKYEYEYETISTPVTLQILVSGTVYSTEQLPTGRHIIGRDITIQNLQVGAGNVAVRLVSAGDFKLYNMRLNKTQSSAEVQIKPNKSCYRPGEAAKVYIYTNKKLVNESGCAGGGPLCPATPISSGDLYVKITNADSVLVPYTLSDKIGGIYTVTLEPRSKSSLRIEVFESTGFYNAKSVAVLSPLQWAETCPDTMCSLVKDFTVNLVGFPTTRIITESNAPRLIINTASCGTYSLTFGNLTSLPLDNEIPVGEAQFVVYWPGDSVTSSNSGTVKEGGSIDIAYTLSQGSLPEYNTCEDCIAAIGKDSTFLAQANGGDENALRALANSKCKDLCLGSGFDAQCVGVICPGYQECKAGKCVDKATKPSECADCTIYDCDSINAFVHGKKVMPEVCLTGGYCTCDPFWSGGGGQNVDKSSGSYSGGKRTDATLPKPPSTTTPTGPDVPAWIKVTNSGCTHLTKEDTMYLVWVIPRSDGKNVVYETSAKYDDVLRRWEFKDSVGVPFKVPKNYPINFGFDFVSASGTCTNIKYDKVITFTGNDMFTNTIDVDIYADEDTKDYVPMKITFTNSACGEDWANDIRLGRKPSVTARWVYSIPSRPGFEMTKNKTLYFGVGEDFIFEMVPKNQEIKFEFDYNSPTCGGENGIQATHTFTGSTTEENTWAVDLGTVGLSKDTVPFKITVKNSECSFWDENRYTEGKSGYIYSGTDPRYIGKSITQEFSLIKGVQSKTWTYDVGRVQKNTPVTFTIKYDNTKCGGVQEKTFTRTFTGDTITANDVTVDIGSELDTGFMIRGTDSTRGSGSRRSIGIDILTKDGVPVNDDNIVDVTATDFTKNYVDISALGLAPGTYTVKATYYVQPLFQDVIVKSHTFDGANSIVVTANNIVNINHDFASDPVDSTVLMTFILTNTNNPSFRWQDHTVTASGQRIENGVKVAYFSEKTYTDIGTNGVRWPNLNMNPTDPRLPVGGNWVFFITLDGEQRVFFRPVTQADINNGTITLDWGFINNTGGIKVTASDSSRQFSLSTYRKTLAIDVRYPGKTTGPGIYVDDRDIEPTFSLSDNYAINEIRNIPVGNWDVRTTLNIETTKGIVSKEYTFTDVIVRNSEMTDLYHDYTDEAELDKLWVDVSLVNSEDPLFGLKKHSVKIEAEYYSCSAYDENPEQCELLSVVPWDEYTDVSSVKWDNVELSVGYWVFDVTLDGKNRRIRWWVTQTDEENGLQIDFATCLPNTKITIMDSNATQDNREYQYTINVASSDWTPASADGDLELKRKDGTTYTCGGQDIDTCISKTVNAKGPKYTFNLKWDAKNPLGQRDVCFYNSFVLTMAMTQIETVEGESSIGYIFPWDIDTRNTAFQVTGAYGECEYIFDMNGGNGVLVTAVGTGCGGWNDEDPALTPLELQGVTEWVESYILLKTPDECMPGHIDVHDTKLKLWWDDRGKTIHAPEFINGNWYWEGVQVDSMSNIMLVELPDAPIGGWTLFRYYDPGLPKGKTINYDVTWGTYNKTGTFKVDRISTEDDPIIVQVSCDAVDMDPLEKLLYRLTKYADAIVGLFVIGGICGLLGLLGYLIKLGKGGMELIAGLIVGIAIIVGGTLLLVLAPEELADVVAIPLRGLMDFIFYILSGM